MDNIPLLSCAEGSADGKPDSLGVPGILQILGKAEGRQTVQSKGHWPVTYSTAAILTLATQCAPNVAPQTVVAIVRTESSGNPFALNVNRARQPRKPTNVAGAVATAQRYVAAGYSVDLGLGQINSRNMRALGLTWANVFDPCTNIAALGKILTQNYQSVLDGREQQHALRLALSMYNTGNTSRGFRNGYVAKVVGNAGVVEPTSVSPAEPSSFNVLAEISAENVSPFPPTKDWRSAPPPTWNLFERAAYERHETASVATIRETNVWID